MSTKKRVNVLEYAGNTVNSYLGKGKLLPEYSVVNVSMANPYGVLFAKYSKALEKYFACASDYIAVSGDGEKFITYSLYGDGLPFLVEDCSDGNGRAAVICGNKATVFSNSKETRKDLKYSLSCGVMHCGRLFGADGYTLRWSGAEGFEDWDEGMHGSGYLKLDAERGKVHNLIIYGGKLVAVREYGLTVFGMYGAPENFSVSGTNSDCDYICKDTACVVGGKIYFYSDSGLKSFDGNKISPIALRHGMVNLKNAVEYGGKYFIAGESEELERNIILCVDTDGESCIIDTPADVLFVKNGVRFFNSKGQYRLKRGGIFNFESRAIDFGTDRFKTITEIKVAGRAKICVKGENFNRDFQIKNGTVNPHMRGKKFIITAQGNEEISEISVTAEVTDAV